MARRPGGRKYVYDPYVGYSQNSRNRLQMDVKIEDST
jgi:hypothetical protein